MNLFEDFADASQPFTLRHAAPQEGQPINWNALAVEIEIEVADEKFAQLALREARQAKFQKQVRKTVRRSNRRFHRENQNGNYH